MSIYAPVVTGETQDLRCDTEDLLCQFPGAIELQLAELSEKAKKLGETAMFGAEIEFIFADNPSAENVSDATDDELYLEIVEYMQDGQPYNNAKLPKGTVISPKYHPEPVIINYKKLGGDITCNDDQKDSGIIEVRTGPAEALEATDRYWRLIEAIGHVAANHGRMATILNTHINTAIEDNMSNEFEDFSTRPSAALAAIIQQNLERIQPLQIDAGLEMGIQVLEAFPRSKDASTAMHQLRLEFRHPLVGVVDPRIDMLAVLDGLIQFNEGTYTKSVIDRIRKCNVVSYESLLDDGRDEALYDLLMICTVFDTDERRFVMPATADTHIRTFAAIQALQNIHKVMGGDAKVADPLADNAKLIRSFIDDLRIVDGNLQLSDDSPYLQHFDNKYLGNIDIALRDRLYRITPHVVPDSPEVHRRRRRDILRSSAVRRMLGDARLYLTPADDAIAARQKLIDNNMIIVEDIEDVAA